ncbi:MAG: hypothetical protein HY525_11290 [Betaproteobacteria bacterium]|nr:hypothetical protein [Betaproteobacteria bacterium]
MKRELRYALGILALAFAAVLPAPAGSPAATESAAEKRDPCALAEAQSEGGIGGTGVTANAGGIGGTGIVGTITGFASVCINGVEVHYGDATPVTINGVPAGVDQLAIGQQAAIEAASDKSGLSARSVALLYAVIGPLERAEPALGRLSVLGQNALLRAPTLVVDTAGKQHPVTALQTGDWIRVSGLRAASGAILATRIERVPVQAQVSLIGDVTQLDAGGFWINGVRIHVLDANIMRGLTRGRQVLVTGVHESGAIRASSVRTDPALSFRPAVRRLLLEGLVADHASGDGFRLGAVMIALDATTRYTGGAAGSLKREQRVIVYARVANDGAVIAESVLFMREPTATPTAGAALPANAGREIADPARRRAPVSLPDGFERPGAGARPPGNAAPGRR